MPLRRKGQPRQKQQDDRQNLANPANVVPVTDLRDEGTMIRVKLTPPKGGISLNTISTLATDDV